MKYLFIFLMVTTQIWFVTDNTYNQFAGKWVAEDHVKIEYFLFDDNGYAEFAANGQIFGGKEFLFRGEKGKMTYEISHNIDDTYYLDFIITNIETEENAKLLCILKLIDRDTILIGTNFENIRPEEFNSKNSITLKREK
ncbi:hypothetical protein [Flagellimonas sp. S3867]|uniref:hypothetical protein n=1 Tax=Flagellimonas sp. S3867 TaxID=2768063 RepID=UPI0016873ABE|nr:hypothetical protein [Flagellimonas sp. S3867]